MAVSDLLPPLPEEHPVTLCVNGREWVTVQATRLDLADWAVGYLLAEGWLADRSDLLGVLADGAAGRVNAEILPCPEWADGVPSGRRYLTSGCTRGVTATSPEAAMQLPPVVSPVRISHDQLIGFQSRMHRAAVLYATHGGIHIAALFRLGTGEMLAREDIGRHNAVDKVIGAAWMAGWDPADLVMLTSGRISYEMCAKAARFGVGVVASRTAVTDQAVRLARALDVELVAYLRPHRMRVYTGGARLLDGSPVPVGGYTYMENRADTKS